MKNLKVLRENANLTQRELAKVFQIAPANIGFYELGKTEPSFDILIKIADYFGCSIDYLLDHETPGIIHLDSFTPIQQKLVSMIKQLNPDQALFLVGYVSDMLNIPYEQVKPQRPW